MMEKSIRCDNDQITIFKLSLAKDLSCNIAGTKCICKDIFSIAIGFDEPYADEIYWCIIDYSDAAKCNLDKFTCTNKKLDGCPDLLIIKEIRRRFRNGYQRCAVIELKTNIKTDEEVEIERYILDAYRQLENSICVPSCCRERRKYIVLRGIERICSKARQRPEKMIHGHDIQRICKNPNHIFKDTNKQLSSEIEMFLYEAD